MNILLKSSFIENFIFPLLLGLLNSKFQLFQFCVEILSLFIVIFPMIDLKLMQFLFKVIHFVLISLDFLLILKRFFNLSFANFPNIFFLDICQLSVQICYNFLEVIFLTSHLVGHLEYGVVIMLDSKMQVVHDVLGLLDISHLLG